MYTLAEEKPADWWEVEALYDLCFAPGREALSSYRLRDGVDPVAGLSLLARDAQGILAGAIRFWPVRVGGRRALLAETCRRLVLEAHAPAAALLNQRLEALYLLGPTEHYLRLSPGHPSLDFLAMAPRAMRVRLRAAAADCLAGGEAVTVPGGRTADDAAFSVELTRVSAEGETLLLACGSSATTPGETLLRIFGPEPPP